ncbi:hypothetical protein CALVIDRAFT_495022 [Calocera viscosa TUFC12733]|uniref:Large ribosomal subunit protein mL46 n=1 Tax=Calocera viscosa (strain TUFC12733) TaxID=1330018 RepID=A0A167Q7S2_CALVF|nr:hypothetical protein CALVIDRAFT_495022 [Calocera viscosa TUFC12733]
MNAVRQRIRPIRLPAHNLVPPAARRWQSTEAPEEPSSSSTEPPTPLVVNLGPESKPYRLLTSVILTRSPLLTPEPTPYESAFYAYQRRIARALSNPFPGEFYFKRGSVGERRFAIEDREREIATFGDKARVNKKEVGELEDSIKEDEERDRPLDRISEADRTGDVRSLDRKGDRSLYLLLKTAEKHAWRFPQGEVLKGEGLHKAAERELMQECGSNMHTWIVGRQPIGVFQREAPPKAENSQGDKIFFFKGHIMAGQAVGSTKDVQDFAWLTMEEIQERLETPDRSYWEAVQSILSA